MQHTLEPRDRARLLDAELEHRCRALGAWYGLQAAEVVSYHVPVEAVRGAKLPPLAELRRLAR